MNVTARQRFWPLKNWFRVERNALDNLEDAGKRIEQAIEKRDASKLKNAITAYGAALNQADRHHGHLRPLEQEAWKRARFFFDDASTFYIDKLVPSLLFKAGQADVDFEAIARMLRHTVERHGDPTEELGNALDAMAENKSLEHESSFGRFKILDNAGLPMQSTETLDTKTLFQALKQVDALFKRRKLDYLLGGVLYLEHSPGRRHGAAYMRRSDRIEINTDATAWAKSLTRNLVHELGHRIWFRFLTSAQRDRFSSQWIEKGEDEEEPGTRLPSVTPYGTTNRHEDFAETFTEVVMGTQKDRRLAERLQSVLPKGRVLSSVTADVKAMNDFVASLNKALPPIEQAAKRVETLLYEWQGTGKVNMRQLKLALTAHAKQVAKLGELKLPSNLRPGEREVLQDKLNSLALFYVQNVADETAKLKKQLAKMEPKKAASAWQYRIGDVAKMVREMSIPGLVDAAGRLVEPELRFGGFTILDNHGIREVRARYWFEIIARASKLLKQKGLDYLLYGKLLLEPVEGWNGLYHSRGDYITLDTGERGRPNDRMLYTFVHELGHRLWFKFLDGGARDKFAGEWVDQAADIDELYRKMASMMKISKQEAEEGWRVLSDGWDMRTFRKWVKSDNVRKLRWFLALKRVYALSVSETERFVTDDGVTNKRAFDLTREHFERLKARTVSRDASIGEGEEGIRRAQEQAQERHDKDMQSMHDDVMRGIENIQFNKYVLRNLLEPDRSDVKTPLPRGMYRKAFDFLPSVRPSITKYGQTNRMEDFAEVFAQTILGINKDRAVQERLQSVLPKGRVLSNVTTAAFNRSAAFAVFKHAVKQLWGAQSSESKDLQDAKNRMVARLTLKLSNDEPKGGVMASLAYDPRTVRTIGDLLVSAAPAYLLRISDRLLEQSADVVKGIMFHEALHVGYPKHDKAFRDMAAQHKIPLTESWTEEPGWKVQRKDGSRYKTLRTFETEEKAREWAMDELKRTPGKYRLSASVLSTEPTHTPIDAIARAAARALDATYDVTGTTIEFEWSPAADPKHPTHRRTTPRLPRGRVIEFAGDPSRNQQYGPHRWTLLTKLPDIASDKRLLEIAMDEFDLDERDALDYINPSDIVETAGAWDSQVFVSRVWEELMAAGYATQDGAVVIDPPSVKLEYDYDGKELYRLVANVRLESDGTRYMWNGTFADARGRKVATVDGRADAARAERTFIAHMQAALKQAEKKIAPRKYRAVGESLPLSQSAAKGAVAIEAERELLYHGTRGPLARAIMDKGLRQDSGFSNFGGQGGVLADAPAMPFKVGDLVRHGKYKNKIAKIVRFGTNDKGQTTVLLEPVPKGRKKTKELGLFKIWTTPDAIEAVASKYKVRTVKQLVREGYTEKQAELIHRNLTDKADTDSWTARKVARDAAKYPRLSDRISDPTVTVYRVVPRGVKNVEVGDYVFRTKQQAESFRDEYGFIRGQPNIITLVAPASHFILPHRDDDELLYVGDIGMGVANATSFDKVLSPATTKRLRADFLLLMKNVKRLHNYKQTLEWNDAVNRWAIRLERYIESASAELGRFRRDEISPDLIKVWQQYLRAALWPLLVEIRATGFDRYEMATRYTYRQHNRLDVERRLFDDFAKQAPKFDARVKRVARESWKRFDQILETMQKSFGERGMKGLPIPQDERIDIEGFSVTLKNLSERGHYKPKDAVDNVRRALAYYRKRAAKTYPWLVRYRLPIILDGEISLEKLAHYDPADKTIWLKASALKPERLAHVIAHEMGHHVWHERLSANDKAYWAAAIKGSRGPLDLRDAIKLGSFAALDKKLMQTDPVMALRLQTFMHDPRFARYDMATVEGIERYLSEGNDPVIQVTTEPITGYASKNDAEAFCEALGLLVGYGPRAVLPIVRERMRMLLPQLKVQASVTAAAKSGAYWLFNNGKLVELDDTHADYVEQNPKPFGLTAEEVEYQGDYLDFTLWPKEVATKLFKKAMRIANSPHSVSFITASPLTARHIKQAQDVLSKLGVNLYRVQIVMGPWDGSTYRVPGNDFMFLKSPRDLKLASAAVVTAAAPLAQQLTTKMEALFRNFNEAESKKVAEWFEQSFGRIKQSRTPSGGKKVKEAADHMLWELRSRANQMRDLEKARKQVEYVWRDKLQPHVAMLVKLFSDEGGVDVPTELKVGGRLYENRVGLSGPKLRAFVQRLEELWKSLKGWRRMALKGELRVVLAGPKDFRGTSAGVYRSQQDAMFVRATPKVMKRSAGTYGAPDYIMIHELGHRYEYKVRRLPVDFERQQWWTTPYSRKDGEQFAELFALGHFNMTNWGTVEFGPVLERFEKVMSGAKVEEKPELPEHLKRFARGAATDELYHTTSLHGLAKILQSRTFLGGRHGGFVSFSEKPVFGDIQANDAVLVLDRTKLRNRVMPVEYDEAWYDRHPEHAAYVAGEGWREQYQEPEDCYDDEGWADENCVEQAYRDAELMSFLYKKEERDWVARSSGDLRLPAEAFKRVVVPKQKLAAAEALLKKLGLRMPVKVLRGKSKATAMVPRGTLRQTTAKDEVDPDQYRKERGRCPRGYGFDGEKCIKTPPKKGRDGPSDDVEDPPKGRGKGEDEKPAETALDDAKHAVEKVKKKLAKPQGPQAEVTKQNPYGLDDETRGAKTAADLGGHEGLRKVLGHLEPSKLPPPDVDPSSIRVNLDGDNDSKAMMTWRDGKGRLQAAYTPKFLNRNAAVKWERVKKLEAKADKAIESFGNRMQDGKLSTRERDAAAIMTIIGKTGLRPGSTSGLKSTGHRGISTLSADNVKVEGGSVSLEFVGKSGKTNRTKIDDPALASYLTDRLKGKAGDELLFDAREKDLPATMEAGGVKGFKPKDFRTRIAGKIAAKTMAELADPPPPMPSNRTKAKKLIEQRIKEASSAVADQLNNTPAMAKKAYINPAIFQTWAESVGASEYAAAAAMARKPTADELWKGALGVKLPGADEQVDVHPELEDDDQLDSVPEPEINSTVEGAVVERIVGPLLEAGHRDLARAFVSRFDA